MAEGSAPLDLVGSSEAAALIGVHVATIARWAADGSLPVAARLTGKTNPLLFHRADVQRIAAERAAPAPSVADAGTAQPTALGVAVLFLLAVLVGLTTPPGVGLATVLAIGLARLAFLVGRAHVDAERVARGRRD